jgi:hypothetical protein
MCANSRPKIHSTKPSRGRCYDHNFPRVLETCAEKHSWVQWQPIKWQFFTIITLIPCPVVIDRGSTSKSRHFRFGSLICIFFLHPYLIETEDSQLRRLFTEVWSKYLERALPHRHHFPGTCWPSILSLLETWSKNT